jgi:hypothetical protein
MATDKAGIGNDFATAREPEIFLEMIFLRRFCREQIHSGGDFDETFFALAIFIARSRHFDAERFRVIEQ